MVSSVDVYSIGLTLNPASVQKALSRTSSDRFSKLASLQVGEYLSIYIYI